MALSPGSSPCVWGQEHSSPVLLGVDGIIPMRVGTRSAFNRAFAKTWDHPHACGDKRLLKDFSQREKGSSPCVWGQVRRISPLLPILRIIPMRVGTRSGLLHPKQAYWDHPHACGDKMYRLYNKRLRKGSSPCVWGQASTASTATSPAGIIPMRVGTSNIFHFLILSNRDHPHACGDKQLATCFVALPLGSSPCVWGQVALLTMAHVSPRIIPMRVGTSLSQRTA